LYTKIAEEARDVPLIDKEFEQLKIEFKRLTATLLGAFQ